MVWIRNLQVPPITIPLANYVDSLPPKIRDFSIDTIDVGPIHLDINIRLRSILESIVIILQPVFGSTILATFQGENLVVDIPSMTIQAIARSSTLAISFPFIVDFVGKIIVNPNTLTPKTIQGTISFPLKPFLKSAIMDTIANWANNLSCPKDVLFVHLDPCKDFGSKYIQDWQDAAEGVVDTLLEPSMASVCLGNVIVGLTSISCTGRDPTIHIPINIAL